MLGLGLIESSGFANVSYGNTDGNAELIITVDAGFTVCLSTDINKILSNFRVIRLRSGASLRPVIQSAERTITVVSVLPY